MADAKPLNDREEAVAAGHIRNIANQAESGKISEKDIVEFKAKIDLATQLGIITKDEAVIEKAGLTGRTPESRAEDKG